MSLHRYAARKDDNHEAICGALRAVGATVQSISGKGCPDLLVGYRRQTYLLELKDPGKSASRRELTPAQVQWHGMWRGLPVAVVMTVEEALTAIGAKR